jgi:tryptophan synthase alpha chain
LSDPSIARAFAAARARHRAALIPFLPAGWPSPAECRAALRLAVDAGADLIEIGIPFSDPLADGPTIQRASQRALEQGMTVAGALELVRDTALHVPVVVMTYLNPVLAYGFGRFLDDAAAAGVAGVLCTDLPAGVAPALEQLLAAGPLDPIRLVAPTTSDQRLGAHRGGRRGFIYLISRLGVTGARPDAAPDIAGCVQRIRAVSSLPVAVGFGISTPAQAAVAARDADGVVVGSALVDALDSGGLQAAQQLLISLGGALRAPDAA